MQVSAYKKNTHLDVFVFKNKKYTSMGVIGGAYNVPYATVAS